MKKRSIERYCTPNIGDWKEFWKSAKFSLRKKLSSLSPFSLKICQLNLVTLFGICFSNRRSHRLCMENPVSSRAPRDVTNSLVRSQRWRSILMVLYVTLDDLPHGISSTRAARECRELSFSLPGRGSYERCPYNRARYARTIASWEEPYYSGRPRDTSCEYRDCDTDGTKSFSVMAVIMRSILPLEVFQLRHSAGLPFIKGTSASSPPPPCDGEFFWWTISPGIAFD